MIYKYKSNMSNNPASVDIGKGVVYINRDMWTRLTPYERAIILLHEEGHYRNKSVDEIQADIYAINAYLADADTPRKRSELLNTIFKIVPDDKRKVEFVKNLLQYESVARPSEQSVAMYKTLSEYTADEANFATAAVAVIGAATKLISVGVSFWQKQKNKETYWRAYKAEKKNEIIHSAAKAAITNKFLSSGGDIAATMAAAKKPYSDSSSLWADTFAIIAAGVKFDPKNFDNRSNLTVGEASAIFWNNSGYGFQWMSDWVGYMQKELEEMWESMTFFEKVKYSSKYKFYLAAFIGACLLVWKIA